MTILAESIDLLTSHRFSLVTVVEDIIEGLGKTHAILEYDGENYSLRAKEYRYKGNASFGLEQVEQAADHDLNLLSYIQDTETFYVFDAKYVAEEGNVYQQPSKHSVTRNWIEVDGDAGVTLTDYLHSNTEPRSLSGKNSTINAFR